MPQENLEPFFRYYNGEPHQMEAVQLLQQSMPQVLLRSDAPWIKQYRNTPEPPPAPAWPVTKEQMAKIMQCSVESLPDSLMDDFARCVSNCQMDTLEIV